MSLAGNTALDMFNQYDTHAHTHIHTHTCTHICGGWRPDKNPQGMSDQSMMMFVNLQFVNLQFVQENSLMTDKNASFVFKH